MVASLIDAAALIENDLSGRGAGRGESTRRELEAGTGPDDQPVFIFTLLLAIPDGFDAADRPSQQVEQLSAEVRSALAGSPVESGTGAWTRRATATAPAE